MRKKTVALLLARGTAGPFAEQDGLKYKALLPINGKPMADYVLRSLQNSSVEKIFIAQTPEEHLQDVLTNHTKNIFINIEGQQDSLSWSLAKSLEKLVENYEIETLKQMLIMITPCDIPMVSAMDFNDLIIQAQSNDANILLTMVPHHLIKDTFPHKRFQKLYHADIKETISMQGIVFVSGEMFRVNPFTSHDECNLIVLDSKGYPLPCLDKMIDLIRQKRHGYWLWPSFMYHVFIRQLIVKGKCIDIFRLALDITFRKITVNKIRYYLFAALGIKTEAVRSHSTTFSGDVDTYQDLKLLCLPYDI
jgi:CTP:molybdopterin cytidylyltransferase MocA